MSDAGKPRYYIDPIPLDDIDLNEILGDTPAAAVRRAIDKHAIMRVARVDKNGSVTGFEVLEDTP